MKGTLNTYVSVLGYMKEISQINALISLLLTFCIENVKVKCKESLNWRLLGAYLVILYHSKLLLWSNVKSDFTENFCYREHRNRLQIACMHARTHAYTHMHTHILRKKSSYLVISIAVVATFIWEELRKTVKNLDIYEV